MKAICANFMQPSGDKRWAVREAAGRIDRIWVLSSTHSAQVTNEQLRRLPSPVRLSPLIQEMAKMLSAGQKHWAPPK